MFEIITVPFARDNYAYLLQSGKQVAILDAGESQPILHVLQQRGWTPDFVLCTHYHQDHVAGNIQLKQRFPSLKIYGHQNAKGKIPEQTHFLQENDEVVLGALKLQVIETFGHTQTCISFYEKNAKFLFSGDCLFLAGCGRLFDGSAEQMYFSFEKIKKLDPVTKIYFGHNLSANNLNFALTLEPSNRFIHRSIAQERNKNISSPTSLETELAINPFLRVDSEEIKQSVSKKIGASTTGYLDLFTKIRYLKDLI